METTIFLTIEDAELFKEFQKNYDTFKLLEKHKAFDIKFGKCILNFAFGTLQNIVKEEVVWHK